MRKSAASTVLSTHTHTRNVPPAPHTKADTSPRAPGSIGAASANQCLRCRAGTGRRGWARLRERNHLLRQLSWWTAAWSWEGGLCPSMPQPSPLISQTEVLWTTRTNSAMLDEFLSGVFCCWSTRKGVITVGMSISWSGAPALAPSHPITGLHKLFGRNSPRLRVRVCPL